MPSPTLIVIPGFLTEPHDLAKQYDHSALHAIDPTALLDRRAWFKILRALCADHVHLEFFDWGSQSVINLFAETFIPLVSGGPKGLKTNLFNVAQELHIAWRSARDDGDKAVSRLCDHITSLPPSIPLYLLGHSLGGRMALKALEKLKVQGYSPLPKVVAWAPAISKGELNSTHLAHSLPPPEILYSQADMVLKFIFPLGQGPQPQKSILQNLSVITHLLQNTDEDKALGLIGPPLSAKALLAISQDLSNKQLTHLGYLPAAQYLFESSLYLSDLLKDEGHDQGERKRLTL